MKWTNLSRQNYLCLALLVAYYARSFSTWLNQICRCYGVYGIYNYSTHRSELSLSIRSLELVEAAPGDVPKIVSLAPLMDSDSDVRSNLQEQKKNTIQRKSHNWIPVNEKKNRKKHDSVTSRMNRKAFSLFLFTAVQYFFVRCCCFHFDFKFIFYYSWSSLRTKKNSYYVLACLIILFCILWKSQCLLTDYPHVYTFDICYEIC